MTSSDQYQFVRELGAGAMGRVSLVRHQVSGQFFALKRMNDHVAASGGARMRQEFRSLAQINHKNVVRVFEFGEENQKPFLDSFLRASFERSEKQPVVILTYQ